MKNIVPAFTMAIVLMMGATFANAGIIISERPVADCTQKDGIIISEGTGIIISEIVRAITGIIISEQKETAPCVAKNGLLIGD